MAKNPNDKYYTNPSEVKKVIEILLRFIKKEDITEIIEPSAGDGAFIEEIKKLGIPYKFYDLIPEHPEIEQKDFKDLMKEMEYKKGRVFVGNPPFGNASSLFKRFRNGAMEKGDWAVYIGPASHWNMKWGLKGMELVYSEHLGGVEYRGLENKKVNTCVNVYRRISGNIVDRRMELLERDFEITNLIKSKKENKERGEWNNPEIRNYDYFICSYGDKTGEWHKEPYLVSYIAIKNKTNKNIEYWIKSFKEKYKDELIKIKPGHSEIINIPFLKQKMIEEFYPTREEMLDRDFKIKSIKYWKEGDKLKRGLERGWERYEYFLGGFGDGVVGVITKEPKYNISWGFKVLNEDKREQLENWLNTFKEKYFKELKESNSAAAIRIDWLKQKMIEEFYSDVPEYFEHTYVETKEIKKEMAVALF